MNSPDGALSSGNEPPPLASDLTLKNRSIIEQAILPLIGGSPSRLVLTDPPFHSNIGDSLIMVGELDFLQRHYPSTALSYVEPLNYSARHDAEIARADVILIHGGGNFGDLYPPHHNFRKWILERFPDRPIIQLPQTLHFDDQREVDETARLISNTKNFTLMVRDHKSRDFANQHFDCPVMLVPDMAYAANPLTRSDPVVDLLAHLRKDIEATFDHEKIRSILAASPHTHIIEDWPRDRRRWSVRAEGKFARLIRRSPFLARWPGFALRAYNARNRVANGVQTLSQGRRVITDRLHGHIFCELMGIEHYFLDSYGHKITRFYDTWSAQSPFATRVESTEALAALLQA